MKITKTQISHLAMLLFFSVALNSDWSAQSVLWWGSVLLALIAAFASHHFQIKFHTTPLKVWYAAFLVVCVLSVGFAIDPTASIETIKTLVVLMVVLFLLDEEIQTKVQLEDFMRIYMAATVIMMVYVCLNINLANFQLAQHGEAEMGRWNGNDVGMKCAIFLLFALYFLDTDKNFWKRLLLLSTSALSIVLLYYTASRKSILIVIAGISMYYYMKHPSKRIRNIIMIALGVYGAYMAMLNVPELYNSIGWRLEGMMALATGKGAADGSALLRLKYIQVGLYAFKKSPIIGYGIDNYRFINRAITGHFTYSHNNFVELLVGVGMAGFIVYYFYFAKLMLEFVIFYFKKKTSLILNITLICFFLIFAMHVAVVSYNDITQYIMILFLSKALTLQKQQMRATESRI